MALIFRNGGSQSPDRRLKEPRNNHYYAFGRIYENLEECNIYLANGKILIRPWIAPTMTHRAFAEVKQKVLMSATLGRSGELERITGLENICRLPIVNDWDKKGLGRKFFVFPDLSLGEEQYGEIVISLQKLCKKSVFLVPDILSADEIKEFYINNLAQVQVFETQSVENSKQEFINADEATVILANRFDGVDFSDEESRLLFIWNLPKVTNLQERFLAIRMGASKLYSERIRTRIIQAVGRCSRNPSDYSIVCVMGDTIQNDLTKQKKMSQYPPELRAEIQFGLENSVEYETIDDMIVQAKDFFSKTEEWLNAEEYIVELRNGYWNEEDKVEQELNKKLYESAILELKFQYAIWKKDYKVAYDYACNIVATLDAPALSGYKCFWNYMTGCMAYYLFKKGESEYRIPSIEYYQDALNGNISIRWLSELPSKLFSLKREESDINDFFFDCIVRIEDIFTSIPTLPKLEKRINEVLEALNSTDGKTFERGHKELGIMLGYIAENPESSGAPDPYWIINENNLIVSEDKIYEEKDQIKDVPIAHVSEAGRHKTWILENEKRISDNANIYTIFITNSQGIEKEARIYATDIYYVQREEYFAWATKALTVIRSVWKTFTDKGQQEWREAIHQKFIQSKITPRDYLSFVSRKKLGDI